MNRKPIFDAVRGMLGRPFTPHDVEVLDAAINVAEGVSPAPRSIADIANFYNSVRGGFGSLSQAQVDGFDVLLPAFGAAHWPLSWAAYGLATTWHETNEQMQPVREAYWLSEAWRKANLRYWPWYGRGYVQLTWEGNYRKADSELGLGGTLIANPDRALEPAIAARIMVLGMSQGWFTRHKLGDYLPDTGRADIEAYQEARRIINGTDKAAKIAGEAEAFQNALLAGGWA